MKKIGNDVMNALMDEKPSNIFEQKKETWISMLPELCALIGCKQNPVYHPEGDVWVHTMQVLDAAANRRVQAENPEGLMLASLCHDLGKPAVTTVTEKGIQSIGHERAGIEPAMTLLERLGLDEYKDYVKAMVLCHMQPRSNWQEKASQKAFNKMFSRVPSPEDLILLGCADNANHEFVYEMEKDLLTFLNIYRQSGQAVKKLTTLVTGKDLAVCGIKSGRIYRDLLAYAEKIQQEQPELSKEEILDLVKTHI